MILKTPEIFPGAKALADIMWQMNDHFCYYSANLLKFQDWVRLLNCLIVFKKLRRVSFPRKRSSFVISLFHTLFGFNF